MRLDRRSARLLFASYEIVRWTVQFLWWICSFKSTSWKCWGKWGKWQTRRCIKTGQRKQKKSALEFSAFEADQIALDDEHNDEPFDASDKDFFLKVLVVNPLIPQSRSIYVVFSSSIIYIYTTVLLWIAQCYTLAFKIQHNIIAIEEFCKP